MTLPRPRLPSGYSPGWPPASLLGQVGEQDRDALLALGTTRRVAGGLPLIVEGDTGGCVYIVLSGFVKVVSDLPSGHQVVLVIRSKGEIIGELAALDGGLRSSSVLAAGRVVVRSIDSRRFRDFLQEHPPIADAVHRSVMAKLRTATRHAVAVSSASVLARLARTIELLADGYGRPDGAGVVLDLPVTQADLASLIGASDKGVRRSIRTLAGAGAIRNGYRHIEVCDAVLLHRFSEDSDEDEAGHGEQRSVAGS